MDDDVGSSPTIYCGYCDLRLTRHLPVAEHPDLGIALCWRCVLPIKDAGREKDEDGYYADCQGCGGEHDQYDGEGALCCSSSIKLKDGSREKCCRIYCRSCVERWHGSGSYEAALAEDDLPWACLRS